MALMLFRKTTTTILQPLLLVGGQTLLLAPTPTSTNPPPLLLHPLFQQVLPYSSKPNRFFPRNVQPSQNTRRLEIRSKRRDPICSVCSKPFVTKVIWKEYKFKLDIISKYCHCGTKFVGGVTHDKCPGCGDDKFNVKKGLAYNVPTKCHFQPLQ